MPRQSQGQKKTVGRVMHEYKHGEHRRDREELIDSDPATCREEHRRRADAECH